MAIGLDQLGGFFHLFPEVHWFLGGRRWGRNEEEKRHGQVKKSVHGEISQSVMSVSLLARSSGGRPSWSSMTRGVEVSVFTLFARWIQTDAIVRHHTVCGKKLQYWHVSVR